MARRLKNGSLAAPGDAQPPGRLVPLRQQATRFHGHRGHALHAELLAPGIGGGAEDCVDIARIGGEHRGAIAVGSRDQHHISACRRVAIGNGGPMVDIEHDRLRRVLGALGAVGQHNGDRLADIADHGIGQHRLRKRCDRRIRPSKRDGRDRPPDILRGHDGVHARHCQGRSRIDRTERPVRHRTAHDRGMPLPRSRQVVDVLAAPAQEPQILHPLDRAADEGIDVSHCRRRGSHRPLIATALGPRGAGP